MVNLQAMKKVDRKKLLTCLDSYVFSDPRMKEGNTISVLRRISTTFENLIYRNKLQSSDKKWLDEDLDDILSGLLDFLKQLV